MLTYFIKQVCDLIGSASSGKRSLGKRDNVACAQCCKAAPNNNTGIPCNGYLCNQSKLSKLKCLLFSNLVRDKRFKTICCLFY